MMHTRIIKLLVISTLILINDINVTAQPKIIDKVIGIVGSEMVLYSDIQGQILELIQNKVPVEEETECILFENFMFNALLLHQADIDSIEANVEQIDIELDAKMAHYRNLLKQYGQTFESAYNKSEVEWREEIRDVMMKRNRIEQVQGKIAANVTITPREVIEYFNKFPKDSIPRINSTVEFGQIIISPKPSNDADIYVRDKLNKWRDQILSGSVSFEKIAKENSQDPGTAEYGGYFECVSKGTFVPEFDAVAMTLKEGEISKPFKTLYGWHILKLEKRRGSSYCGYHILRTNLITNSVLESANLRLDSISSEIKKGKLDFCLAARLYSDDEESKYNCGKVFNMVDGSTVWDVSTLERDVAVMIDMMDIGDVTKPFLIEEQGQKSYKIVYVYNRAQPHLANLTDDYELIQRAALNEKKQKAVDKWVNQKIAGSYVWVDEMYKPCTSQYNWAKPSAD